MHSLIRDPARRDPFRSLISPWYSLLGGKNSRLRAGISTANTPCYCGLLRRPSSGNADFC